MLQMQHTESAARTKTASSNIVAAAKALDRDMPKLKSIVDKLEFIRCKLLGGGEASEALQGIFGSIAADIQLRGDKLHCNNCKGRLISTIHLSFHECEDRAISSAAMEAAGLVTASGQCALCGRVVGGSTHKCISRFFTKLALDFGAMKSACITGANFMEAQLSQLLRMTGVPLTVMVAFRCPKTRKLTVMPYLLGPSEGKGMGLYAAVSVSKGQIMMYYCGLQLDTLDEKEANDAWLAACEEVLLACHSDTYMLTLQGDQQVDPTACGSVPCMVNCAHDAVLNMSVKLATLHGRPAQIMSSSRKVLAGEELFWDYNCVTDDPKDKLLKLKCRCHKKCAEKLARLVKKAV